eukprot:12122189-Alexandrium_andersonii.AAC.1
MADCGLKRLAALAGLTLADVCVSFNPQSAMRNMLNRFRRSEFELRGPRSGLKPGPRSSRGAICS